MSKTVLPRHYNTLQKCLKIFEDSLFVINRAQCFQNLHLLLQDKELGQVTAQEVLRILDLFQDCLKHDVPSIPHALTAVLTLLTNAKVISSIPAQDVLPSLLAIIQMLKTLQPSDTQLRTLGVQVFLSFPVEVLTLLVRHNCSGVLEVIEDFATQIPLGTSKLLHMFLKELLTELPPHERQQLIKEGLPIWFTSIFVVMNQFGSSENDSTALEDVAFLEELTNFLLDVDYFQCQQWQDILKCICLTKLYPNTILKLLKKTSSTWYRLWIVFVRLLKNQITRSSSYGTPIQPMLEVLETAFKMDAQSRCKAFHCWDILIDSLSTDTNPKSIPRYLKLLLIPLKPKNAKTEDAVQAKFNTWWNLIRKFQHKLDQFTIEVLVEFLHFMFGKNVYAEKHVSSLTGAGQMYDSIKCQCLQALSEIVGHSANCGCCIQLPKLDEKMLNNKLLASHWDEWMGALKSAIIITSTIHQNDADNIMEVPIHVLCVFRSMVLSIAELPPNGVRKDMFYELIQVLTDLLQFSSVSDTMPFLLLSLSLLLTEDNESIKKLMVPSKGDDQLLRKIIAIILDPTMNVVFERYKTSKIVEILQPLARLAVDSSNINSYLDCLVQSNGSLKLWATLVHFVNETPLFVTSRILRQMLMWPVHAMQNITVDLETSCVWQRLYNTYAEKTGNKELDLELGKHVNKDVYKDNALFKLIITISILKNRLSHPDEDVSEFSKIFGIQTCEIIKMEYKTYEPVIPMLVDTITAMLDNVLITFDEGLAILSLECVKNVLVMFAEIKPQEGKNIGPMIYAVIDNIFNSLKPLSKSALTSDIFCEFLQDLRSHLMKTPNKEESSIFKYILTKIKYLRLSSPIDTIKTKMDKCFDIFIEKYLNVNDPNTNSKTVVEFTSPNVNKVAKRPKKKEAVIVNTVTENGEEYAVVKSNWKFNPKMLTENQKEKLQRKREDIPALYQDLSQSQDEFKLTKWKTDSQDTSMSSNSKSSKLTTDNDAGNILKNIESSDVVPNIMQNILSENERSHTSGSNEINTASTDKPEKSHPVKSLPSTPKGVKSPRLALKDRVFRNVRNLIEKSSPKIGTTNEISDEDQLKRTPSAKITKNANIVNSAPSLISTERPSRLKKIPKKFADVQLFGLKKRRYSQSDTHLENESEIPDKLSKLAREKSADRTTLSIGNDSEVNVHQTVNAGQSDITEAQKPDCLKDAQQLVTTISENENTKEISEKIDADDVCDTRNNVNNTSAVQAPGNDLNCDNNNEHDKLKKENSESHVQLEDLSKQDEIQCNQDTIAPDVQETDSSQHCQKTDDNQDVQMLDVPQNNSENKLSAKQTEVEGAANQNDDNCTNKEITTTTPVQITKQASQKSTAKKSTKKSRIEKELAIDMVEGHPFLKMQSEKRLTRKKLMETENESRRKSAPSNSTKTKAQTKTPKSKETESTKRSPKSSPVTVEETQDRNISLEEAPCSEDVIESSQDSNFTTTTVKSAKRTSKRLAIVSVERMEINDLEKNTGTQDLLQDSDCEMLCDTNNAINQETKDDIELPQNKTAEVDKNDSDLTENMDTEPVNSEKINDDVIIINDEMESPITVSSEKIGGSETEELAEADTQPNDSEAFTDHEQLPLQPDTQNTALDITVSLSPSKLTSVITPESQKDVIEILTEPSPSNNDNDICSPFKDDAQRKQDFLNNTSEISPIKIQSPDKSKSSPEKNEETSSDYLVVKLSSPVHSNGEPYSSKGSPEFFTDDKTSPDKRDQSPPRVEVVASSGSPSSSLSLKKNRPQSMRPSGRGAHLVGLCVPESITPKSNPEKTDFEEPRNIQPSTSTPARRNLRVLYNAVSDNDSKQDKEPDNFLKLKKDLPSVDSSPAVPILKRKIDIVDDTASPATKRKRVSFHDPPVSTTVSVQKYIKPDSIESPSTSKRLEAYMTRNSIKSQKKIDNTLKLDKCLSKTIESFADLPSDSLNNDTNTSLDVTPAVEVVITSELNDSDPICPDLVDCKDPIENVAAELSSPAMKDLFIKELDGKVSTVGDLAKMTELEVNRLRIKAPKVQVAKKVLEGYVSKRVTTEPVEVLEPIVLEDETVIATEMNEDMKDSEIEPQVTVEMKLAATQTCVTTENVRVQTVESGSKSTSEIIASCLSERDDFIAELADALPSDSIIDIVSRDQSRSKDILKKLLDLMKLSNEENSVENFLKDYMLERFDQKKLILFCSRLLHDLHDIST